MSLENAIDRLAAAIEKLAEARPPAMVPPATAPAAVPPPPEMPFAAEELPPEPPKPARGRGRPKAEPAPAVPVIEPEAPPPSEPDSEDVDSILKSLGL